MTNSLKQRIPLALFEVALVVGVLYFLGYRDWLFIGSIATAIGISALSPPRFAPIVSGVCLLALAALFYLHFKLEKIPIVLGALGLIALIYGAVRLAPRRS